MIDLRDIGRGGIIIQYEDIISMIGYNVAKHYRGNNISKKLDNTSIQDVLLSYINRTDEDWSEWFFKEYNIRINPSDMLTSFLTMQPNLLYAYKIFTVAHQEKIDNLYIYSDNYSPIAEQSIDSFGFSGVKYVHSDILKFLNEHPNFTYTTSSTKNIKKCLETESPVCLVICDDYLYLSDIFHSKVDEELRAKPNIFLQFTSVISAGVI